MVLPDQSQRQKNSCWVSQTPRNAVCAVLGFDTGDLRMYHHILADAVLHIFEALRFYRFSLESTVLGADFSFDTVNQ
jgi:hypothetical protein